MCVFRIIPPGDLALKNGSPYFIDGPDYIRQKLSIRFRFFFGEWFMNRLEGVPYFRDVFTHDPDLDVVTSLFKRVIQGCPGVTGLTGFQLFYDPVARSLSFSFTASTETGDFTVAPDHVDFLVDTNRLVANTNAQRVAV